jgi:ribosomal protein S18 acetylase RimI-like enzyme
MNYRLEKILPSDIGFQQAMAIYEQSLPSNERQPNSVIEDRLNQGLCTLYGVMEGNAVIGMMVIWIFEDTPFTFLDYLAVHQDYRGKGIGEFCMQKIREEFAKMNKSMLIEVEDPDFGEDRVTKIRRIRFYEKCGSKWLVNTPYIIPPLDGTDPTPMLVLIIANEDVTQLDGASVRDILRRIYRSVYEKSEDDLLLNSFINKIGDTILLEKYPE